MLTSQECRQFKEFTDRYQKSFYYPLSRRVLGALKGVDQPVIVDLGTGPGYLTQMLAEQTEGWIRSVDINPAMHEIARGVLAASHAKARVSFELADVHELPFADQSVDAIVSYTCYHHYAEPVRALLECLRVLRTGGIFMMIDCQPVSAEALARMRLGVESDEEFAIATKAFSEAVSQTDLRGHLHLAGIRNYELRDFVYSEDELMDAIEHLDESHFQAEEKIEPILWILTLRKEGAWNTIA